jgi:polyhydroxyalkanoate synthesis repressor PhaR
MATRAKTIIKKYGNRRLYNTGSRRYVNLAEIARLIREGADVQVVDARTGEDLSRVVLTQIIEEDVRGEGGGPPLQLLRQLVVASDRATHDLVSWYVTTTQELYQKAQEAAQSRLSEARQAAGSPLEFVRNLLSTQLMPPSRETTEVEELRRKVRELEARLDAKRQRARRKPGKKKASKPS